MATPFLTRNTTDLLSGEKTTALFRLLARFGSPSKSSKGFCHSWVSQILTRFPPLMARNFPSGENAVARESMESSNPVSVATSDREAVSQTVAFGSLSSLLAATSNLPSGENTTQEVLLVVSVSFLSPRQS